MTRESEEAIAYAVILLSHYGFDLRGYTAQELVNRWLEKYQPNWIGLAVIEALYQGRYKAVSVEQLLTVWQRRGQPIYHFNHEFERLICRKLPQNLAMPFREVTLNLNQESDILLLADNYQKTTDNSSLLEVSQHQEPTPIAEPDHLPSAMLAIELKNQVSVQSETSLAEAEADIDMYPLYTGDMPHIEASNNAIQQFTPPPDYSGFYLKLKKVVEEQD